MEQTTIAPPSCFICLDPITNTLEQIKCSACDHVRLCVYCLNSWIHKHAKTLQLACVCGNETGFRTSLTQFRQRHALISHFVEKTLTSHYMAKTKCTEHEALRHIWGFVDFYYAKLCTPWIIPSYPIITLWKLFEEQTDIYRVWTHHLKLASIPCFKLAHVINKADNSRVHLPPRGFYFASAKEVALTNQFYPRNDPLLWPGVDFYEDAIQIFIRTLSGSTLALPVQRNETLDQFKLTLSRLVNIEPRDLHLVFGGKRLDDDNTLESYNIQNLSTLHMVMFLRGD